MVRRILQRGCKNIEGGSKKTCYEAEDAGDYKGTGIF